MKKVGKVDIFGKTYTIHQGKMNDAYAGLCDYQSQKITIHEQCKGDDFTATLIHEVLHAAFQRMSVKQTGLHSQAEELIVDQLANVMTENFRIKLKK